MKFLIRNNKNITTKRILFLMTAYLSYISEKIFTTRKCIMEWRFSLQIGFKGYGLTPAKVNAVGKFNYEGKEYELKHGSVVIAAITSCTNTSNPSVMLGAGMERTEYKAYN